MMNLLKSFQKRNRARSPDSLQKAVIPITYTRSEHVCVRVCVCLFLRVVPRVTEGEVLRHTLIFLHNKQASISRDRLNTTSTQQTISIFFFSILFTQATQTERSDYLARHQNINRKDISSTLGHSHQLSGVRAKSRWHFLCCFFFFIQCTSLQICQRSWQVHNGLNGLCARE